MMQQDQPGGLQQPPAKKIISKSKIKPVNAAGEGSTPLGVSRIENFSRGSSFEEGRAQQNIVAETEAFLLQRVHFIQVDHQASVISGSEYQVEDDKFLKFLEQAANGTINAQDLHAFSLEPRLRTESSKAALSYVLNLRSKATTLLQQLKLSQLTSSSQNEQQQDNARLKAKLKLLENVRKDELIKRLEAKEHECLEYRAKLDKIQPMASLDSFKLQPVAVLEAEVERQMADLQAKMDATRQKVAGLMQEMSIVKTTVREKIVIPINQQQQSDAVINELESRIADQSTIQHRSQEHQSAIAHQTITQANQQLDITGEQQQTDGIEEVKIAPEDDEQPPWIPTQEHRTIEQQRMTTRQPLDRGLTLPLTQQARVQSQGMLQTINSTRSLPRHSIQQPGTGQATHAGGAGSRMNHQNSLQFSVAARQRVPEEQYEAIYFEQLDQEQANQLMKLYEEAQIELNNLAEMEAALLNEKKILHLDTTRIRHQEQTILTNSRFLESKLAETLTLKEEQNIKLKSEIVIYRNKLQRQKQKTKDAVSTFETKKIHEMRQQSDDEVALKMLEIEQLQKHLEAKNQGMANLEAQIQEFNQKIMQNEIDQSQQAHEQNLIINELSEQLKGINETHSTKLQQIDHIRENTQKRLNLEEQERTMNSLKLDYLVNNNRKLQNQKKYLMKTLDSDLKKLSTEMRKSEIEMQRDAFITSQNAQGKLKQIYMIVKESLGYVKEVVEFMNFELGDQIHGKLQQEEEDSNASLPKRQQEPEPEHVAINTESTPPKSELQQKSLDQYFYRNIHEIAEAVLSVLCEVYQEGNTQTQLEVVHLFTLIQSKTDKSVVQDIYNKYFAQNRIHFLQSIKRTVNRNATLEREKAEMRRKLEDQNKQIKELQHSKGSSRGHLLSRDPSSGTSPQILSELKLLESAQPVDSQPTHRTLSPAAVVSALQRFQERKVIESQEEEISALKARMRDVRLNLQRQISDLQDQLSIAKKHHQANLTQLMQEYGRDHDALHRSHLLKEDELRDQMEVSYQEKIEQLADEYKARLKEIEGTHENDVENRRKDIERNELIVQELLRELRKLKKKANLTAQGGWGTFSIVFEDNQKKHHPLLMHSSTYNPNSTSGSGALGKKGDNYETSSQKSDEMGGNSKSGEERKISPEQLSHFIEIGFMMDQKNFRLLDTYKESTFDSKITKFLFELQDTPSNDRAVQLQNRLKSQLYENFALFNEINPIYITLNLGRNVSPFWDDGSLSQENFKLIKREAIYLAGEHYLTVNFLRCEEPYLVIRVIAFDNDSCTSYNFDLNYEDLMLFVDGNMRLLDSDNQNDLCLMITNNLTRFNSKEVLQDAGGDDSGGDGDRSMDGENDTSHIERADTKYSKMMSRSQTNFGAKQPHAEITLAVEHKIFFNEAYRNEYERNKLILAKNDKRKKGLLQDKGQNTDFEKSIVYEAFDIIYTDVLALSRHYNGTIQSQISLGLLSGRMSGHKVLKLAFETYKLQDEETGKSGNSRSVGTDPVVQTVFMQDLCLYESDVTKQKLTQQISSLIVKIPEEHQNILDRVLALALSFERIFNSENFIIRIAEVKRYDEDTMSRFQWDPESRPTAGSLKHKEHTIFLVRKNNKEYIRLEHYEILNTEVRSLLFKHSYGYDLSIVDFGKLTAVNSDAVRLRLPLEQHVNRLRPSRVRTDGMNFLLRDFGIIRIKTMTTIFVGQAKTTIEPIREINHRADSPTSRIDIDSDDGELQQQQIEMEDNDNQEDEELFTLENHYCTFAFYDDFKCLSRGELYLTLHIDGIYLNLTQKLSGIGTFLQLPPQEFAKLIATEKERLCRQVFDQLVVVKSVQEGAPSQYRVLVDSKSVKMSEIIDRLKREKLRREVDKDDMLDNEFDEVKGLGINLNVLAECEKTTQVSIVNRKVYKIICYFVNNLKNIKLQPLSSEKLFDWQLIYVEAESRFSTKSMVIPVTEGDIKKLVEQLIDRQHSGQQLLKNEFDILSSRLTRSKKLIEFILDALVIDEQHNILKLSISHLLCRMQDRLMLHQYFKIQGGRYLPTPYAPQFTQQTATQSQVIGSGTMPSTVLDSGDVEMRSFKTSLPQIEMSRRLLVNVEKDFSDHRYDIRIFEVTLKHANHQKKYQFEMYPVDQVQGSSPVLFRCDFLSQAQQSGKKLLIERFNIVQQLHQDFEESKYLKDGLVLSVLEQGFPHSINFLVLEPVSHIQWQYVVSDDKLNPIENRNDKEYFVKTCKNKIEQGLWFSQLQPSQPGLTPTPQNTVVELQKLGYQKGLLGEMPHNNTGQHVELWTGNLKAVFSGNQLIQNSNIIYQREVDIGEGVFASVALVSSVQDYGTVKLIVNGKVETDFVIDAKRESARFLAGFLPVIDEEGAEKGRLMYAIEEACGYTEQERAFRLVIREPKSGRTLVDFVLSEKHIINIQAQPQGFNLYTIRDEVKYAFNTGFRDSFALYQKLPDLITDFKNAFIIHEPRLRFSPPIDNSRVLLRKVVSLDHKTFLIFLKCDTMESLMDLFKIHLFEQASGYEEIFQFTTKKILTKDECVALSGNNPKAVLQKVVDRRLKLRAVGDEVLLVNEQREGDTTERYVAYFLDSEALEGAAAPPNTVSKFDIRSGQRFSLVKPELAIKADTEAIPEEKLISQLEKEDLLFDVSEVLNPYQLILRIKTYDRDTLKVLAISDIAEKDIKEEVTRDQVSYLLSEPHRREELARYMVQNAFYDENRKKVYFLQSSK